jgi:hypothetical protein
MQPAPPVAKGPLAMWKAMPFPRKLMFLMLPFGLVAFVIVFTDPPEPKPGARAKSSASAAVSAGGAPSASAPQVADAAPVATPAPTGAPPDATVSPSSLPPESSAKPPEPSPKPPEPAPSASAPAEPPLAKGELSMERKAADAVANNDFAKAADLYDQLAKAHPENPAYARAAEILRKKAKK